MASFEDQLNLMNMSEEETLAFENYLYALVQASGYSDLETFLKATDSSVDDFFKLYSNPTGQHLSYAVPMYGKITNPNTTMINLDPFDTTTSNNYGWSNSRGVVPYEFENLGTSKEIIVPDMMEPDTPKVPDGGLIDEPVVPTFVPTVVIPKNDERINVEIPDELKALTLGTDVAFTPSTEFFDASSIVNPGQALGYGLMKVGSSVAQGLLDKSGRPDVAVTYDRAKDLNLMRDYGLKSGAELVVDDDDGTLKLSYPKSAFSDGSGGSGVTYNTFMASRAMGQLPPEEDFELTNDQLDGYGETFPLRTYDMNYSIYKNDLSDSTSTNDSTGNTFPSTFDSIAKLSTEGK